jgi:hypothetical protein
MIRLRRLIILIAALLCATATHSEEQPIAMVPSLENEASAVNQAVAVREKITQVTKAMTEEQTFALLGAPSKMESYETGKRFTPFYFGSDTRRTDWIYEGVGRVVFSTNRYGKPAVVEVLLENR